MTDPQHPAGSAPGGWPTGYPAGSDPSRGHPPQAAPYQQAAPYSPQAAPYAMQGPPGHSYPAGPPAPTHPPEHHSGGALLALGAGLGIVVAVIAVGVLLLTNVLSWGATDQAAASGQATDTTPITMPDTAAGHRTTVAVTTEKKPEAGSALAKRNQNTIDATSKAFQHAYGGAAVGVQMYASEDLQLLTTAVAVRAESPGLTYGPVTDPADLGLAQNQQELVTVGEAECLVYNTRTVTAGQTPDPKDQVTTLCQRTGPALTVQVYGDAGASTGSSQSDLVAMVNDLYAHLGGS